MAFLLGHTLLKEKRRLIPLGVFSVLIISVAFKRTPNDKSASLTLTNQFGRTQLIHQKAQQLTVFERPFTGADYSLDMFRQAVNARSTSKTELVPLFSFNDKKVLLVDGSYNADLELNEVFALLLTDNAKIHLDPWIGKFKPEIILADGSSFPAVKERWAKTAKKRRLPFHDTAKQGAFVFE